MNFIIILRTMYFDLVLDIAPASSNTDDSLRSESISGFIPKWIFCIEVYYSDLFVGYILDMIIIFLSSHVSRLMFIVRVVGLEYWPSTIGNRWAACAPRQSFYDINGLAIRVLVNRSGLRLPRKCGSSQIINT